LKIVYGEQTLGMVLHKEKLILCDRSLEPYQGKKETTEHILRFTIAHEIGHIILHRLHMEDGESPLFYTKLEDKERSRIEIQANIFAGRLLIPDRRLEKVYSRNVLNALTQFMIHKKLSDIFNVSKEVIRIRLKAH
jgi:Zn-dependent peptidase ImmA (M78 family)